MGGLVIDPNPTDAHDDSGGPTQPTPQNRQQWVRANFTQIFGTSAADLQARGIDPRSYAREHRDQIRQFAQSQRRQGLTVPSGRPNGANAGGPATGGYGYGGAGRFGMGLGLGRRGGSAWVGIVLALFALRFLLVDSFAGSHAAVFWVLGIGGIMLVVRVFLFSWLRRRRFTRRQSGGGPNGRSGF
jgi:hypothetical protein